MIIDKIIIDDKEVIKITAEDKKNLVRINNGVLICKEYIFKEGDSIKDFIEVDDGNDYRVMRKNAYPSVEELFDMIWHSIDEDKPLDKDSDFYKSIKAVKDKYPKEGV